ncbi:MAG: NAD(P)H-binding protein, partial [Micrococcales bacterium]
MSATEISAGLKIMRGSRGDKPLALVTGATGYIGGRLIPELLAAGYRVRVLARNVERLKYQPWLNDVEVFEGDATNSQAVTESLKNVDVAYYLLHALMSKNDFEAKEAELAEIFASSAKSQKVKRIIYLGGIISSDSALSPHLKSRADTGEILRNSGVPTIELRAGVVIGSGSASFEMLRYLTERLPFMITPKWLNVRIQPIAVRDVLRYLVGAAVIDKSISGHFDIGGPDIFSYK